ncbi:MAG: hypothetical protein ACOC8L_07745, partial [Spirochaetota bacterium]
RVCGAKRYQDALDRRHPTPQGLDAESDSIRIGTMVVRSIVDRAGGSADLTVSGGTIRRAIRYPLERT